MQETSYRKPKTNQYRCLKCGFQAGSMTFKPVGTEGQKLVITCPDCDSSEVVDADTMARVNPVQ